MEAPTLVQWTSHVVAFQSRDRSSEREGAGTLLCLDGWGTTEGQGLTFDHGPDPDNDFEVTASYFQIAQGRRTQQMCAQKRAQGGSVIKRKVGACQLIEQHRQGHPRDDTSWMQGCHGSWVVTYDSARI